MSALALRPPPRSAVYLAPHRHVQRFKLGHSIQPRARLQLLPEARSDELDWGRVRVLWLPDTRAARRMESALHKFLAPFRLPAVHRGDGATEWFADQAFMPALRVIQQVPWQQSMRPELLVPTADEPSLPDPWPLPDQWPAQPAQQWLAIEDLWERAAQLLRLELHAQGPVRVLRLRGFRSLEYWDLRVRLANVESYAIRCPDSTRSLVQLIDLDGDDLLLTLTEVRALRRWPAAGDLEQALQHFIHRIHSRPRGWR